MLDIRKGTQDDMRTSGEFLREGHHFVGPIPANQHLRGCVASVQPVVNEISLSWGCLDRFPNMNDEIGCLFVLF